MKGSGAHGDACKLDPAVPVYLPLSAELIPVMASVAVVSGEYEWSVVASPGNSPSEGACFMATASMGQSKFPSSVVMGLSDCTGGLGSKFIVLVL